MGSLKIPDNKCACCATGNGSKNFWIYSKKVGSSTNYSGGSILTQERYLKFCVEICDKCEAFIKDHESKIQNKRFYLVLALSIICGMAGYYIKIIGKTIDMKDLEMAIIFFFMPLLILGKWAFKSDMKIAASKKCVGSLVLQKNKDVVEVSPVFVNKDYQKMFTEVNS